MTESQIKFNYGQELFTDNALGDRVRCTYIKSVIDGVHSVRVTEGIYRGIVYKFAEELFLDNPTAAIPISSET